MIERRPSSSSKAQQSERFQPERKGQSSIASRMAYKSGSIPLSSQNLETRYALNRQLSDEGKLRRISAVDRLTQQPAIINIFKSDFVEHSAVNHQQFLTNLSQLTAVEDARVNPILAVGSDYFVVHQPAEPSLRTLIDAPKPLTIEAAVKIAKSIAQTLTLTHAADLLHYNLKPENIFVTDDHQVILDNFQFLNPTDLSHNHHTPTTSTNYTYLSPESCDVTEVDARVDIWALGIILFEITTGQLPFYDDNPLRLMLSIMRQPIPDLQRLNPEIPNSAADLIYRMLAKSKNHRIPQMQLVLEFLTHIDAHLDVDDPQPFAFATDQTVQREDSLPFIGPLIGRFGEFEKIEQQLLEHDARLVSLIGPGGIGKSHLAISIGQSLKDTLEHGVAYADFEAVDDPHLAVATITNSLNFRTFGREDAQIQLQKFLQNKRLLLVLDNITFPDTATPIVQAILDQAPAVKILTTSHESLDILQTVPVPLQGLPVKQSDDGEYLKSCPACQLFVLTARKQQYDFTPDANLWPVIRRICEMVGGVPLAIELAAGRLQQMTAEEIFVELSGDLTVLDSNSAKIPAKHRSIHTLYQQTWQELSQEERDTLKMLSVFVGGMHFEAIEEVTGSRSGTINQLVAKSLLHRSAEDGLYYLQPLLRKMATERLSAAPSLKIASRNRHSRYFLKSLARLISGLRGGDQLNALTRIDQNYGNLRKAAQWALANYDLDLIDIWLEAMYLYFIMRGRHSEGFKIFTDIGRQINLIYNDEPNSFSLKAQLRRLALARFVSHDLDLKQMLIEYLAIARQLERPEEVVFALVQLSAQPVSNEERMAYCIEAIDIGLPIGRHDLITQVYNWLAFVLFKKHQFLDALVLLDQCLQLQRELEDTFWISKSLNNQGIVYNNHGELKIARELLSESAELSEMFNNQVGLGEVYVNLTRNAIFSRDIPRAEQYNQKAIQTFVHIGNPSGHLTALYNRAEIAFLSDDLKKVTAVCDLALELCDQYHLPQSKFNFLRLKGRAALSQYKFIEAKSYLIQVLDDRSNPNNQLSAIADFAELFAQTQNVHLAYQLSIYVKSATSSAKLKDQVETIINHLRHATPLKTIKKSLSSIQECRQQILAAAA